MEAMSWENLQVMEVSQVKKVAVKVAVVVLASEELKWIGEGVAMQKVMLGELVSVVQQLARLQAMEGVEMLVVVLGEAVSEELKWIEEGVMVQKVMLAGLASVVPRKVREKILVKLEGLAWWLVEPLQLEVVELLWVLLILLKFLVLVIVTLCQFQQS